MYGNGRGVIERRFVRGDLNVFLCVCGKSCEGWGRWRVWRGFVFGSLVLFGSYSAKEARLSSLMPPPPPSFLPSLYKVANLPGTDGKNVILKAAIASKLEQHFNR